MAIKEGDILAVSLRGTVFQQRIILTNTWRCREAPVVVRSEVETAQYFADKMGAPGPPATLRSAYLNCQAENFVLDVIRAQIISPVRAALRENIIGVDGTRGLPTTVSNLAGVITLRTDLAGRGEVATKHVGPMWDAARINGILTAAAEGALLQLRDEIIRTFDEIPNNFGVWEPVIFHRTPAPGKPNFSLLTSGIVQPTVRVMRRRTVGLGE